MVYLISNGRITEITVIFIAASKCYKEFFESTFAGIFLQSKLKCLENFEAFFVRP